MKSYHFTSLFAIIPIAFAVPFPAVYTRSFPPSSAWHQSTDYAAIVNLIASYPLAVDTKNATLLASLFTTNAVETMTEPSSTTTGSAAIAAYDLYAFQGLTTFHQLSTQLIDIDSGTTGSVLTYFAATVFGADCYAGQIVTAYGTYADTVVKTNGRTWQIKNRAQTYAVSQISHPPMSS